MTPAASLQCYKLVHCLRRHSLPCNAFCLSRRIWSLKHWSFPWFLVKILYRGKERIPNDSLVFFSFSV